MELRQWVCWVWVPRKNGRPQKMPIDPTTGKAASVTNRSTWSTLEKALHSRTEFDLEGIGFVFTEEDRFAGIDLDDCRDPETQKITRWARKIIEAVNSYSEISPSGTGIKIFLKGEFPRSAKGEHVEMYDRFRFFTVTGWHVKGTPPDITQPDPDILLKLYQKCRRLKAPKMSESPSATSERRITLLARSDPQKGKSAFRQLFDGDTLGKPSPSEADFALCLKLARLTNCNVYQIDSIFRQSRLFRAKWDRAYSDGTTYGQRTIEKAIEFLKKVD